MRISAKRPLLILAITAALCSRTVLALFDDPEGPNLLVVTALAAVIFAVSAGAFLSPVAPSLAGARRTGAAILLQLLTATGLFLALR